MIVGLITILLILLSLALGLFILIQQGKGDMGLGGLGGGSQVLFGGSGGQDFFQKATWVMGLLFMGLCLFLTVYKDRQTALAGHVYQKQTADTLEEPAVPVATAATDFSSQESDVLPQPTPETSQQ